MWESAKWVGTLWLPFKPTPERIPSKSHITPNDMKPKHHARLEECPFVRPSFGVGVDLQRSSLDIEQLKCSSPDQGKYDIHSQCGT